MKFKIALLLLLSNLSFAQIKGVVVDENNKPIPYVNIWIENEKTGTTSEQDGTFSIDKKNKESNLIFSTIGYETKTIKATDVEKVILKTVAIKLDEVVINKIETNEEKEIGYYESNGFRYRMNYFFNALFFKISKEEREKYPYIKKVKFKTLSKNENAKIRMYFVEVNEDGSPSEKMLSEELILEVKKGNSKNKIDFSANKITIPENGFFIVFEKLKIEQNKHQEEYNFKDKDGNKIIRKGLSYQPEIPLSPVEEEIGWNKITNNKWEKSSKTILQNPNSYENILMKKYHNRYLVPSVNITLSN